MPPPIKRALSIILIIFGVIIVLLAIPRKEHQTKDISPAKQVENRKVLMDALSHAKTETNFNFISFIGNDDWEGFKRAEKDIQSLGAGQVIVPGIVKDPVNKNVVYFASVIVVEGDGEPAEILVSIYEYNTVDFHFNRLYKKTIVYDDFGLGSVISYNVVGYDNDHLILLKRVGNPVPVKYPECTNLLLETGDLVSMQIANPYAGLKEYVPSKEVLEEAGVWEDLCHDAKGIQN